MLALPIFPGSHPPSIVGANELNFCVRDGNRWTLIAINTNSYGWGLPHLLYQKPRRAALLDENLYRIKAQRSGFDSETTNHDTGEETSSLVFERCIMSEELVTHTGFEPMLTA